MKFNHKVREDFTKENKGGMPNFEIQSNNSY